MSIEKSLTGQTLPQRPDIVRFGDVMNESTLRYMQRAADELNLTLEKPRYRFVVDADSEFHFDGRRLADGWQRVRLLAPLTETDVSELWARAGEIEAEFEHSGS